LTIAQLVGIQYEKPAEGVQFVKPAEGIQYVKPADVKERLKIYFSQNNEKWLLIFDNADDMEMWTKGS
jgi:hypothetical protein